MRDLGSLFREYSPRNRILETMALDLACEKYRSLHFSNLPKWNAPIERRHPSPVYRNLHFVMPSKLEYISMKKGTRPTCIKAPVFSLFPNWNIPHSKMKDGSSPLCTEAFIFQAFQTENIPMKEDTPFHCTKAPVFSRLPN